METQGIVGGIIKGSDHAHYLHGEWDGTGIAQKGHPVTITKLSRGFIATVGCHKLAFNTRKEVLKALQDYWDNPTKAQKKYIGEE